MKSNGVLHLCLGRYLITYLNLPLKLQTHDLMIILYVYRRVKRLNRHMWGIFYCTCALMGLNVSISCKFKLILIDLKKRFQIYNLRISILERSHQDQDMITEE